MERTRNESGSALIIATVVVMVVVGMSAALLSDTVFKARATENAVEADEDMLLCEAALEKTRRALSFTETRAAGTGMIFSSIATGWRRTRKPSNPPTRASF